MGYPPAFTRVGAGLCALLLAASAHGAGFALIEHGVKGLGNAFAGGVAVAEDATTVFFNPAGMTRLDGTRASTALHVILPTAEFSNGGSRGPGGVATSGGDGGDAGGAVLVPNFYYVRDLSERWKFGFGANAPFGLATDYARDWVGRYHALESNIRTVNLNPSLAYRLDEAWSVGAGLNLMYVDVEISRAMDVCALGGAPGACDGFTAVQGDDWATGFNLGLLYAPAPGTRVGLAYRSGLDPDLRGRADFRFHPGTPAPLRTALVGAGMIDGAGASAALPLPASASVGFYHALNPAWAVMGDITWTEWSRLDRVTIHFDSGLNPSHLDLRYEDAFRYGLGLTYQPAGPWTWRAGMAYDEEPIRDATTRTARLPGNDRLWLAFGASYAPARDFSLDFGYAHLFVRESRIDNTSPDLPGVQHTLTGRYDMAVDLLSAQVNWRFH